MGGGDAAAGSRLGGSPTLPSTAVSPVGNWLLWLVPALQGTELLLQGQQGAWQAGWQAARLLQLTSAIPDSEQYTQLPDACPALAGAEQWCSSQSQHCLAKPGGSCASTSHPCTGVMFQHQY